MISILLLVALQQPPLLNAHFQEPESRHLSAEFGFEGGLPNLSGARAGELSKAIVPHGLLRLRYTDSALIKKSLLDIDYNTDTLSLSLGTSAFETIDYAKFTLRAQGAGANLLFDYAQGGVQVPERAFFAGSVLAQGELYFARGPFVLGLTQGVRQWLSFAGPNTDDDYVLPNNDQHLESTFSFRTPYAKRKGVFATLHGVELSGAATLYTRLNTRAWGNKEEGRNQNNDLFAMKAQTLLSLGAREDLQTLSPWLRLDLSAGTTQGADDRLRFLLGGENPYVEPLAGAGWAEFLVDHYARLHAEIGADFSELLRFSLGVDAALANDIGRVGDNRFDELNGMFAEAQLALFERFWLRARWAQGLSLPRLEGDQGAKFFVHLEGLIF